MFVVVYLQGVVFDDGGVDGIGVDGVFVLVYVGYQCDLVGMVQEVVVVFGIQYLVFFIGEQYDVIIVGQ